MSSEERTPLQSIVPVRHIAYARNTPERHIVIRRGEANVQIEHNVLFPVDLKLCTREKENTQREDARVRATRAAEEAIKRENQKKASIDRYNDILMRRVEENARKERELTRRKQEEHSKEVSIPPVRRRKILKRKKTKPKTENKVEKENGSKKTRHVSPKGGKKKKRTNRLAFVDEVCERTAAARNILLGKEAPQLAEKDTKSGGNVVKIQRCTFKTEDVHEEPPSEPREIVEARRYIDAIRVKMLESLQTKQVHTPSLCACSTETVLDSAVVHYNNCEYYKNQDLYVEDLANLLDSMDL